MVWTAPISVALLSVPFVGLWLWVAANHQREWREAFVWACLGWASLASLIVTLASIGAPSELASSRQGYLRAGTLVAAWVLPALVGGWSIWVHRNLARQGLGRCRSTWAGANLAERALWLTLAVCSVTVGLIALWAAPNNWDSMTYHLTRVVAWAKLGGVAHYATHVQPQLYHPPGAELLIAQWYVLTGGDWLAASVQWFAYVGSMVVASLAAARLGAPRTGQLIAAVLVATLPMAVLQGSSTQNDLVVGFWLLAAATFTLGVRRAGSTRASDAAALGAGAALSLAVLTKGTALVFGAPIAVLCVLWHLHTRGLARASVAVVVSILMLGVLNGAHWAANIETFGTPVATGSRAEPNLYRNETAAPSTLVSNLVRNSALHLKLPGERANSGVERTTRTLLEMLGIDPDDPRTTFLGQDFRLSAFGSHEDHASSSLVFVLALWAAVMTLAVRRYRRADRVAWVMMLIASTLLFCITIKWQVWHARLHLPVFLLSAPLIAIALSRVRRSWPVALTMTLVVASSTVYMAYNYTRPLLGDRSIVSTDRTTQYFAPRPQLEAPYREAVTMLSDEGIRRAGIIGQGDDWEYPLWVLGARAHPAVRFLDVFVENDSALHGEPALPDGVVCLRCSGSHRERLRKEGLVSRPLTAQVSDTQPLFQKDQASPVEVWIRS